MRELSKLTSKPRKSTVNCVVRKDLAVNTILTACGNGADHVGGVNVFDIRVWDFTLENTLQMAANIRELRIA